MIFVVEDDESIRELVIYTLQSTGFEAEGFMKGSEMFEAMKNVLPDLILLDIMLPEEDGISILKKLRKNASTQEVPIMMVTAKGTEYDKVLGLDLGADDYVSKPFGMMELVSRVKALLRRTNKKNLVQDKIISAGDITLDLGKHCVIAGGNNVVLTFKEFELLRMLLEAEGRVMTRDHLLEVIWGYDFDGETRTVDVHVRTLRQKLADYGNAIETVRGVGYRISSK